MESGEDGERCGEHLLVKTCSSAEVGHLRPYHARPPRNAHIMRLRTKVVCAGAHSAKAARDGN